MHVEGSHPAGEQKKGKDTINFNIPGTGVQTISVPPNSPLPPIDKPVTINGYTQTGATPNSVTQPGETDAAPKIELRGPGPDSTTVGSMEGLDINASNVVVKGLVINNFSRNGIDISGACAVIEGNFIGTNPDGDTDQGNGFNGVNTLASDVTTGGTRPEARNLISGNNFNGVNISNADSIRVLGNLIGTDKSGTVALDNGGLGVRITGSGNTVGDSDPSDGLTNAANTIAFNGSDGVQVSAAGNTGHRILGNSIFSNGDLGIDLNPNGPTANDAGDADTGANNLQNYPDITSARISDDPFFGDTTDIVGELNSTPSTRKKKRTFIIQFFSSPAADVDPSGFGEGKTFLGEIQVKTDRQGNAPISFSIQAVSEGEYITATATNKKTGDTSEFSNARIVQGPII